MLCAEQRNKNKAALLFFLIFSFFIQAVLTPFVEAGGERKGEIKREIESVHLDHTPGKHLLIILVPQFSFNDVESFVTALPKKIEKDLHFAAMSMRTAGAMNIQNNLLTLSTGQRTVGLLAWNAYQGEEEMEGHRVRELYTQWGGQASNAPILHPAIFQLRESWLKNGHAVEYLGWLGEELEKEEIAAYAFGNSDVLEEKNRFAPTVTMNKEGEAKGIINEQILSTNPYFPTGKQTNWSKLSTEIKSIWEKDEASLIVVELGDLQRIYSQKTKMAGDYATQVKEKWIKEWAMWMEELIDQSEQMNHSTSLWVISPMVSQEAKQQGKMLAPFVAWSTNQGNTLLSTATTKQAGIVTNLDLLPSIIHFFQLEQPSRIPGKRIQPSESAGLLSIGEQGLEISPWLGFLDYLFMIYEARRDVITAYIVIVIGLLLLTTGYWWLDKTRKEATTAIRITIGGILLSPFYFLLLTPLIKWFLEWQWISLLLLLSIVTSWLLTLVCQKDALFLAVIGFINTFAILFDLWQGSAKMMRSFLGYDPIIGARFYGLGNEYAGILLGSSLLGIIGLYIWLGQDKLFSGRWKERNKRIFLGFTIGFYAIILYIVAAPNYGTNVGATIASLFTYGFALAVFISLRWNMKWILGAGVALILFLLAFISLHMNNEHTHVSAALHLIFSGDIHSFMEIVRRKWEMNMRLIRVSLWGKLFVTSLLVLVIIMYRLKKKKSPTFSKDMWFQGFRTIIVGSILILLVNDSGIVAAATTIIYVTFPFIYLRFSEKSGLK